MRKKALFALFIFIFLPMLSFAEPKIAISGTMEWENFCMTSVVSLDLPSTGLKLPAGRTQGESLLSTGYPKLIQEYILSIQVDSSSTIADLIDRGEITIFDVHNFLKNTVQVPPAMSPDLLHLTSYNSFSLSNVSSALMRHTRAAPVMRTLLPVPTPGYTGIIIIAYEQLPVHGMKSPAFAVPCLFPKLWDSELNLVYERSMLELPNSSMVRYAQLHDIFSNSPSGLSPDLIKIAGEKPLRIFAKGVFGSKPTDLIIDKRDAMLIISSQANRRLLSEGKVVIILNDSLLKKEF